MIAILLCAAILLLASVVIGRAAMLALGWSRPEWLAGAVGFAILITLAPFLVRLPGRGLTSAILLALLAVGCAVVTRRAAPDGPGDAGAGHGEGPRAPHLVALLVVPAVLLVACLPFAVNDSTGVLGEGIYTNDQGAQLYWADWLADGFGPQPNAVSFGYPVGPQALAATVSEGTGFDLVSAFNGLLIAIPALTALAALSALSGLTPLARGMAAGLTGLPYLGASFLAQSGFKETVVALFVLALGITLHLATRRDGEEREPPPIRAVVGVVALLGAGAVFAFSIPGVAWFAIAIPVWAILQWGFSRGTGGVDAALAAASRHRGLILGGALALLVLAGIVLGPASGFIDKIGSVQNSKGRLSSPVWPGEALGVWVQGDYRVVRGQVSGAFLMTGFAALCAAGGALTLVRRREWALLSVLGAAAFVYALSRPFAEIHVEAKALAVLAPVTMLVVTRWLLAPVASTASAIRLGAGALFVSLALASTFVALRDAPVGFDDRGREDLRALAERAEGDPVVFLGVDRFAGYWLRGTLAESPGGYVPRDIDGRDEKTWQQGLAMDFDTLSPSKLDRFDWAITTSAAYASEPPVNFAEVEREGEYVLWERSGETPSSKVLDGEDGDPGETLECPVPPSAGEATVLADPVVVRQDGWGQTFPLAAPASAAIGLEVPSGEWSASLQYHSQVPLQVSANGRAIAELPPSLEGFYLVGAGRGAFWPAGELDAAGGPVTITVSAAEPSGFQDLLGAERKVWLGTFALTSRDEPAEVPLASACGRYVDHYLPADR